MALLSRMGDINTTGGKILSGARTVFANGKPVGKLMSLVTPHPPAPKVATHIAAKVVTGSPTVFCEGQPVLRTGSRCSCGHSIVQGSLTINVP
jgi:uncharacterized Zn-binding protein involved in type VI secretion